MKRLTDLNQLYYFVQIVRYKGFSAASRAIAIPKSRLSRHLADLESHLGVKLIQRNTRHFHLTDIGKRYFEHCEAMLIEAEAAQSVVETAFSEPSGVLKISCPLLLLDLHVGSIITEFMRQYPKVKIELEASNRVVDVMAEGFDISIRARAEIQSDDLIAKVFSQRQQILVGSPALLQQYTIHTPHDLHPIPVLALGKAHQNFYWEFTHPNEKNIVLNFEPLLVTTDMHTLLKGALASNGVVKLPYLLVEPYLKQGILTHILPQWCLPEDIIHAVYASRRGQLPTVKIFLQHMEAFYAQIENEQ